MKNPNVLNNINTVQKTEVKVKKTNKDKDSNKKNKSNEEENSNSHGQKTSSKDQNTQDQAEKIIDTERIPNQEESIFAKLCSNTSKNSTNNENTLGEKLNNYFNSSAIEKELQKIGVPTDKFGSVIKKLKDYLKRYTEEKIDLNKLQAKFYSYFENVKFINQDIISKNNQISTIIDGIKNEIFSHIIEEKGNQTDITFGENSPRESDDQDNDNKSFLEIPHLDLSAINPHLDLSAINNPDSKKNQFFKKIFNDSHNTIKLVTTLVENFDKIKEEGLKTKTNINELLGEFAEKITNGDTNKLKIKTLLKIYENKLRYKISPETEKLIIDLVLETEKYIESVKQIVKDYEMSDDTKARILEAIDNSTSKKSLEENIGKFEEGKGILKLMPKKNKLRMGEYIQR
jgi:hypothetical protein